MQAEIICVGTELLLGSIVNTHPAYLSRELARLGIDVYWHTTVGDNPERLAEALTRARTRSDLVIVTGGLGPTVDDITMATIARVYKRPLLVHRKTLTHIRRIYAAYRVRSTGSAVKQASVPRTSTVLFNKHGTAPGIILSEGTHRIVVLPGPPNELIPMVREALIPRLARRTARPVILSRTIHTTGIPESVVDRRVGDLLRLRPPLTVGIYSQKGQVDLVVTVKAATRIAAERLLVRTERKIRARLDRAITGTDGQTLEQTVGALLTRHRATVATAESCTGGLLASRLTDVPGSTAYMTCGMIAYRNSDKKQLLGISAKLLAARGAVSRGVAGSMARAIRSRADATYGIGITGIAGPGGATPSKPVGLVFIALAHAHGVIVKRHLFSGTRADIKFQSTQKALDLLRLTVLTKGSTR